HVDLTASDLERSKRFYDRVLPLLGYARIADAEDGPLWRAGRVEFGLQAARKDASAHDRYSPGLHHLAFAAPSPRAVDELHERLVALGVTGLHAPALHEGYRHGCS